MPPAYIKAYIKRGKTDAAEAEAICEAVTRPTMCFVVVRAWNSKASLCCKTRDLLVRQRTMLINALALTNQTASPTLSTRFCCQRCELVIALKQGKLVILSNSLRA